MLILNINKSIFEKDFLQMCVTSDMFWEGGGHTDDIIQNMRDAGCDKEIIKKICRLYSDGQIQDAVKVLKRHRCHLMEQLHESQSKVDCLDFLVRQMEKGW